MNPAEREELARLLPSPGEPVLPSDRQTLLKDHLMREFTKEADPRPIPPPRPRPLRRVALVAVPLATAAVVVAISLGTAGTGAPAEPDQEAVALLDRIATAAGAKETVPVRDDQFVYTRVQGTDLWEDGKDWEYERTDWQAIKGGRTGLARTVVLDPPAGGGPFRDGKSTQDMTMYPGSGPSDYRRLEALPTDPQKMYEKIWADTEGQGPTHEEAAMEAIDTLLDRAVLIPDVSAALYRAAAKIPGVSVVPEATDAAGRHGIGLTFQDSDDRDTWVFDRTTLDYLGTDETALLEIGIVDRIGQQPAG
ncbi:CU044_5270 family protein [Streptomyces spinoverrucosus]|uniref:CU044_5270 family protein n=1 Tax=Streptomyces spinoverrucosus TaxID=284043 RepID=UPI0018C370C5|nr:CU044_5270 family protein [Streptomyces spinoverrucosus]MBG0854528.1 CU044_5270 family protein [Streptomyces spinoverrucosus]